MRESAGIGRAGAQRRAWLGIDSMHSHETLQYRYSTEVSGTMSARG
jgi:hypothetical protein